MKEENKPNLTMMMLSKAFEMFAVDLKRRAYNEKPLYNSNVTEEELKELEKKVQDIISKDCLSPGEAAEYLNMSRTTFYRRVAAGEIPKGHKEKYKPKYWSKIELDIFKHKK
jgi:predicted DNA-binding transcriptional regulator AlpA